MAVDVAAQSLLDKFRDLRLIYAKYCDYLGQERLDPHRRLEQVLACVESCKLIQGTQICVDGFYEFTKPAQANGAVASPTATPLDDNSVGALLSLDQAMETLAARVTPAVVNVAVTSHGRNEISDGGDQQAPPGEKIEQAFNAASGPNRITSRSAQAERE